MIPVNMASITGSLFDSEFFGHTKGAYTGATSDRKGLLEQVSTGTLFLDEIGTLSLDLQGKLLRVLQNGEFIKIGTNTPRRTGTRFIAATNEDLDELIKKKLFRNDLYYRLKGGWLHLPPLRERKEDILALANLFLTKYSNDHHLPRAILTDETLDLLENYTWPGNIRELKNALEAGIVLCKNNTITPLDLQLEAARSKVSQPSENIPGFSIGDSEKETIIRALKKTNGVQKNAAELLNISRRSIHYKVKKYDIKISECKR